MPAEGTPQITVNRAEIAGLATKSSRVFRVGPLFPDVDAPRAQVCFVRIAGKKPEQLLRDPAEGNLLRRDDRKTFFEIETRLKSEVRNCPDTGAVFMLSAVRKDGL